MRRRDNLRREDKPRNPDKKGNAGAAVKVCPREAEPAEIVLTPRRVSDTPVGVVQRRDRR